MKLETKQRSSKSPVDMKLISILLSFILVLITYPLTTYASPSFADSSKQSRGLSIKPKITSLAALNSGQYRALIIGNDRYAQNNNNVWKPLKTAVKDANAVASILRQEYGFKDINVLTNATRKEILLALQSLSKRVMRNDSVLVYYAGHGFLDDDSNKGYWIPVDAKGTDHTTYVRNSTVRDEVSLIASRSQHTLLISDSCFSGSLLRGDTRGIQIQEKNERYYDKVSKKKSVQILTAGGIEYVDDNYQQSGHSPFSYFLLNELDTNEQPRITLSELASNVEKAVANNSDQIPESGVLYGAGDELGEFVFVKVKLNVEVEGVPKDRVKVLVELDTGNTGKSITTIKKNSNDLKLLIGGQLNLLSFEGNNNSSTGTQFEGNGQGLELKLELQTGRWYAGLNLLGTNFDFDDGSPSREPSSGATPNTENVQIERGEISFIAGYNFWPQVSLFLGTTFYSHEWQDQDHKLDYSGLEFGISGFHSLNDQWRLYGSFALIPLTIKIEDEEVGDSGGSSITIGAIYQINPNTQLNIAIEGQNQTNEFDNGVEQTHRIGGLVLGISHRFLL